MKKTYRYVVEFSKPVWPRRIADRLTGEFEQLQETELVCVKDLQSNITNTYRPRKMKNWFVLVRKQIIGV